MRWVIREIQHSRKRGKKEPAHRGCFFRLSIFERLTRSRRADNAQDKPARD